MKTKLKIILWTLPLVIIVLTVVYIHFYSSGLAMPRNLVVKPSENISKIIGVNFGLSKLYVSTDSGVIYSLLFYEYPPNTISLPAQWIQEKDNQVDISPVQEYGGERFTPPPPPFKLKQVFQFGIPATESTFENRFALAEDGNIWYWSYAYGAYQGLFYAMILIIEILVYPFALIIYFVIFLTKIIIKKIRDRSPNYH